MSSLRRFLNLSAIALLQACGSPSTQNPGEPEAHGGSGPNATGGAISVGGATNSGGTSGAPSAGGATSTAGTTSDGGTPSTAGAAQGGRATTNGGSAGATSTAGGPNANGGSNSGGAPASGGRSAGGAAGATASGGSASTGALIRNDMFWKDTSGTPIYSQGGGVLQVGDTYYWYGVKYNGAVSYASNTRKNSDTSFNAVTAYSSKDLVNWKFESNVLSASASGTEVAGASWLGRLGVAYNATTKKYVLVSQYQGTAGNGELFATSDTPTGAFKFDHIQETVTNVANSTTGDQTIFNDDDGKAYVICSSSMGRANLYVAPLRAADFLNVEPATRIFGGAGREGNAMFKYKDHYYFCSSDLHGWNASHTYCISATNIMGPYGSEFVMQNTDADFSHVTQTGFFITVQGSQQSTVIFAGDRWSDFAGNGLGFNQWMPLTFNGTTPIFQSVSEWSIDAVTGQWSVGPDNNYALNPSFEADRVSIMQPAGWTTSTSTSGATPFSNVSGGHTGNWAWQLSNDANYQATLDQGLTGLPNGTYTLSVWAKSTGGQTQADLYAKGFGGTDKTAALTTAMSSWTQVKLTGIDVSNGQAHIGVTTTASAKQSLTLDDFTLIKN